MLINELNDKQIHFLNRLVDKTERAKLENIMASLKSLGNMDAIDRYGLVGKKIDYLSQVFMGEYNLAEIAEYLEATKR